jgi:hypothetical protein
MSCADVQTIQSGDGLKKQFSFNFPYIFKSEIHVYFWDATIKEWDEILTTDATYPWQIDDANPTIVEFTGDAPPNRTDQVLGENEDYVDNVKIRRITNTDDIRALFNPGSAIRSDDLNKNFEQLRYALQEANCPGVPEDVEEYLKDYYWDRFDNTIYYGDTWPASGTDDTKIATTGAIDKRFHDNQDDTVRSDESWVSGDDKIATTEAIDDRFFDGVDETVYSTDSWASGVSDQKIATSYAIDKEIKRSIEENITGIQGIDVVKTSPGSGNITIGIEEGGIDFNEIVDDAIITNSQSQAEILADPDQNSGESNLLSDSRILTGSASEHRYRNYYQQSTPSTGNAANPLRGQFWLRPGPDPNDPESTTNTLSMWNGTNWIGVASGGTFTNQPTTIYVDRYSGDDVINDGRRIIHQVRTIERALELANDGDMISVAPGVYQENLPLNIRQKNLSIIGDSIRSVFIQPKNENTYNGEVEPGLDNSYEMRDTLQYTDEVKNPNFNSAQPESPTNLRWISQTLLDDPNATPPSNSNYNQTVESNMFRLNSGTYIANMTFVGMKANGTRGQHPIDNHVDYGLPEKQGWIFGLMPGCYIAKSPYIQNCTNFSDSAIDNSQEFDPSNSGFDPDTNQARPGYAGDNTSSPTGGAIIVDGNVPNINSPLRSVVADSFTQVGLNGPGILVCNNGYTQLTSSYSFFTHYHLKALNGGQANLAASTTDFGQYALIADGKSTSAIFSDNVVGNYSVGATSIEVGNGTASSSWHGSSTRPAPNMLLSVNNGNQIYAITGAVPGDLVSYNNNPGGYTGSWVVSISNPDPANKATNRGITVDVNNATAAEFYLRSMIASSGHTMEYVGSGTDYNALPENGGVPDETRQIIERDRGKVWAVTVDHKGKLKAGEDFAVDQETGAVLLGTGALAIPTLITNLDTNGKTITDGQGDIQIGTDVSMGLNKIKGLATAQPGDSGATAANKSYVDQEVGVNATAISSNASNISTNTSNISTNTANIATNTSNIATNTANIATNTSNISTNTTDIAGKLSLNGGVMTGDIDLDGNDLVDVGALNTVGNVTIGGNLTVNGTTTNISSTTLQVEDRNIELGTIATPTDSTANTGGITLKGATDKTFTWLSFSDSWTSSEHLNVVFGKEYQIAGNSVLSSTGLGSTVVNSSLETLGTIGTGTWNGTTIGVDYGGTGQTSYTDGELLIGNSNGNTLTKATLTGGNGVTVTNGNGSINLDADLKANGGLVFDNGEIKVDLTATDIDTFADGELLIGNATTNSLDKATLGASNGLFVANGAGSVSIIGNNASISQRGVVQLNNSTTSSSETLAATSKALKDGLDSKLNLTGGMLTNHLYLQSTSGVRFYDTAASGWVGLAAPISAFNQTITFLLPTAVPSVNNQALISSTGGAFSFGQPVGAAQGGGTNFCFYENPTNVTTDYTITTGNNAMSAGPITVNAGVTVTVPTGSSWNIV